MIVAKDIAILTGPPHHSDHPDTCLDCRRSAKCAKHVDEEELERPEARYERMKGSPLPYETPPPPSRKRRVKKPKQHRR